MNACLCESCNHDVTEQESSIRAKRVGDIETVCYFCNKCFDRMLAVLQGARERASR